MAKRKYLTKEDILKARDIAKQEVEVPEWGGTVIVQAMTGEERDIFEASILEQTGGDLKKTLRNTRARLIAASLVDKEGNLQFSEEDVEVLGKKSARALDRIFTVAQRLSGVRDEDIDELLKNFVGGQVGGSTFG